MSGEEEVPVGVQARFGLPVRKSDEAVLVRDAKSAPDILSHCAVRARNSGVLLTRLRSFKGRARWSDVGLA